jgi:hypothetical protein
MRFICKNNNKKKKFRLLIFCQIKININKNNKNIKMTDNFNNYYLIQKRQTNPKNMQSIMYAVNGYILRFIIVDSIIEYSRLIHHFAECSLFSN